jgi:hypothetical protein
MLIIIIEADNSKVKQRIRVQYFSYLFVENIQDESLPLNLER